MYNEKKIPHVFLFRNYYAGSSLFSFNKESSQKIHESTRKMVVFVVHFVNLYLKVEQQIVTK